MSEVRLFAPAKVNLWLDVLGRRADGWHELDTGMLALDLGDRLTVRLDERPGVRLDVGGPALEDDVPRDGTNLAARAAALALADSGRAGEVGLAVALEKHVPSAAGLGGGSSDAAAAWLGACRALDHAPDRARAVAALASLGSDCVFFHEAAATGFARCLGRGERVAPLALAREDRAAWTVALLAPSVRCRTADVYAAWSRSLSGTPASSSVRENALCRTEAEVRGGLSNDLEGAALAAAPELRAWRDLLDQTDASHYLLSGSGSTFFGLYRDRSAARDDLARLTGEARRRGLVPRGHWLASPAGRGAGEER